MAFTCGHCKAPHASPAVARACHEGRVTPCGWLVERVVGWVDEETGDSDYAQVEGDCGADAVHTDRGWSCEAGHSHVTAETRHAEGWDYAESYGEALALAGAGVEPITMSGHVVVGPQSFAA